MTYNENQIKALRPKTWGAWVKGTWCVLSAYLKENAERRFSELGADSGVHLCDHKVSGEPVDQIVENHFYSIDAGEYLPEYHIEYNR